jgi:hypothetical protein
MIRGGVVFAAAMLTAACGSRSYERIPPLTAEVTIHEEEGYGGTAAFRACFMDPADQQPGGKKTTCNPDIEHARAESSCIYYDKVPTPGWLDLGAVRLEDQQGHRRRFPLRADGSYQVLGLAEGQFDRRGPLTLDAGGGSDAEGFVADFPSIAAPVGEFSYVGSPSLSSGLTLSWQGVDPTASFYVSLSHGEQYAACYYKASSKSRLVAPEILQRFAATGVLELKIALVLEQREVREVEGSRFTIKRYRPTVPSKLVTLVP